MVTLRPYQVQGQMDIWAGWSASDILMFVLATGGGKTVTFVDVAKQYLAQGKTVLLIAHREELINQMWLELYNNRIFAGIIKGGTKPNYDLRAQVGSIQTLSRRQLDKLPKPDLIIVDEGHHCQEDNTYGSVLNHWTDAKVLIVTATPYRLNGRGFVNLVKGKETKLILNRTMFELQDDAYLVPFKFYVCSIPDMTGVRVKGGDWDADEAEQRMKLAPLVESYKERALGKTCIVFAVNVRHSKSIVQQYLDAGIPAEHVDGETPTEERADIFRRFTNRETLILVNVGIATEGVDIPGIDAVQFACPSKSLSKVIQMLGRASRALKGIVDDPTLRTAEDRAYAIANSSKPWGIVLDNAGVLIEHYQILQGRINWDYYFQGTKRAPKPITDEIEIITYVAEDEDGRQVRTRNPKEIEGLKLIEVTQENRQKVINIKSLKEFDKYYAMAKNISKIKKKGWFAMEQYLNYCKKNSFYVNVACWDYLEQTLVKNIEEQVQYLQSKTEAEQGPNGLLQPEFSIAIAKIRARGLSKGQFKFFRQQYAQTNPEVNSFAQPEEAMPVSQ